MRIEFLCDIDNNDIPQNVTYEQIHDYCSFSIDIEIENIELTFNSDVMTIEKESIQNFIDKFENNQNCSMTFNLGNGSCINFATNNKLTFIVYTYKEGTYTTISLHINVNNNNHNQLNNIFRQLLEFKTTFDNINIIDEDGENIYSDGENNNFDNQNQ